MDGKAAPGRSLLQLVGDMAELVAKAFFSGLAAAVAMGAAILALSMNAQAATINDTKTGELLLKAEAAGTYTVAPKVSTEVAIQVSGTFSSPNVESRKDTGRLQSATFRRQPPSRRESLNFNC